MNIRVSMFPDVVLNVGPEEFLDLSRMGLVLEVLSDISVTEVKDADSSSADEQEGVS